MIEGRALPALTVSPAAQRAHKGCVKRRVFGFGSQLFMSLKVRLGCGL